MKTYKEILEGSAPDKSVLKKLGVKSADVTVIPSSNKASSFILLQVKDEETVKNALAIGMKNIKGKWKGGATWKGVSLDGGRMPDVEYNWDSNTIKFPKDLK